MSKKELLLVDNDSPSTVRRAIVRDSLVFNDPSLTLQSFKDESDINNIVRKYKKSGVLTHVTSEVAKLGDFADVPDFQTAMNLVTRAQQEFEQLPSVIRKRFSNDPSEFVDFINDENNRDEAIRLGLIKPSIIAKEPPPIGGATSGLLDVTGGTDTIS